MQQKPKFWLSRLTAAARGQGFVGYQPACAYLLKSKQRCTPKTTASPVYATWLLAAGSCCVWTLTMFKDALCRRLVRRQLLWCSLMEFHILNELSCNGMQAAELRAAGQTAAALVCLQKLSALDPTHGPAWYGRAKLHASLRQWPDAAAAYEQAAKLQSEVSVLTRAVWVLMQCDKVPATPVCWSASAVYHAQR